jgi:hypothetical protein
LPFRRVPLNVNPLKKGRNMFLIGITYLYQIREM